VYLTYLGVSLAGCLGDSEDSELGRPGPGVPKVQVTHPQLEVVRMPVVSQCHWLLGRDLDSESARGSVSDSELAWQPQSQLSPARGRPLCHGASASGTPSPNPGPTQARVPSQLKLKAALDCRQ
jgi:hypothetical protein